jgi:3-hydroxyacyl-[acyl-carrier-protein] dehydratase
VSGFDPVSLGLPHREPFIFIDSVIELAPGESACCRKVFGKDESFFRGHFPGNPVVPGVILTEALAQTAGIAAGQPGKSFLLSAIKGMKFLAAVRPEEEIILRARKLGAVGALWQFETIAQVGGVTVADGVVVLSEAVRG